MGRLIDADAFAESLIYCDGVGRKSFELVLNALKEQPTAYNPEKVVEELENTNKDEVNAGMCPSGFIHCLTAIEIVRKGGVE